MATMKAALQAKQETKQILEGLPGVNGIGITWDDEGKPCVRVNIDFQIPEESRKKIPSSVQGIPIQVEERGSIETE